MSESWILYRNIFIQLLWITAIVAIANVINNLVSLASMIDSGVGISLLSLMTTLGLWYLRLRAGIMMNQVAYQQIVGQPTTIKMAFFQTKKTFKSFVWNHLWILIVLTIPIGVAVFFQSMALELVIKLPIVIALALIICFIWSHLYFAPIHAQFNGVGKKHLKWSYQVVSKNRKHVTLMLFAGCFIFYMPFYLYNPMDFGIEVTPSMIFMSGVIESMIFFFAMPYSACVGMHLYHQLENNREMGE